MYNFGRCFGSFRGFGGYGSFGGGVFMMIPLLILIIVVIYLIFRYTNRHIIQSNQPIYSQNSNRALDILKERYAKGEISDAEYAAKKEQLLN